MDGLKALFEDKVPVEAYGRLRQEVERFTITKDRIKVVDFDKLLDHIIAGFKRYASLLMQPLDLIYHAFTVKLNCFDLL